MNHVPMVMRLDFWRNRHYDQDDCYDAIGSPMSRPLLACCMKRFWCLSCRFNVWEHTGLKLKCLWGPGEFAWKQWHPSYHNHISNEEICRFMNNLPPQE